MASVIEQMIDDENGTEHDGTVVQAYIKSKLHTIKTTKMVALVS